MSDHESTAKVISKIKLPGDTTVYEIHDANAIHTVEELGLSQALVFKGIKESEVEVYQLTNVKVGEVYLVSSTGIEYICKTAIGQTANKDAWEKLGNIHNAASTTHKHAVTVELGTNSDNVLGSDTTFTVTGGSPITSKLATTSVKTISSIDAGTEASWTATVSSDGILSFGWTKNTPTKVVFTNSTVATGQLGGTGASVATGISAIGVTAKSDDIVTALTGVSVTKVESSTPRD